MANYVATPNMNLTVPTTGVDTGPQYANLINGDLNIIDAHNHSPGSGVYITPNGININSDLTMVGNNLTNINTARFNSLSAPITAAAPNIGCIYVSGNELYYNDYSGGHSIQITINGSVHAGAGSIGGLPSGTASVNYSSSTYVFQASTNVTANLDFGSAILRNNTPSSFGLTLSPPTLGSNYSITLPSLPASTSVLLMDNVGNITASVPTYQAFAPTGVVLPFAGTSVPSGWLLCNGASVLTTTYSALFSVIGYAFGGSGGSFNIPNMIDSAPFGIGNRFSIGQTGGYVDPSLNTLFNHAHTVGDPGHTHSIPAFGASSAGSHVVATSGSTETAVTNSSLTGVQVFPTGNTAQYGNMPPFLGMNYIIKT